VDAQAARAGSTRTRAPAAAGETTPDGLTVLTLYLGLLLVIPAPMTFSAMGQVGGPATVVALGCFVWWLWDRIHRPMERGRGGAPVRNAALVLLLAVLLAYAHSAGLPLPPEERTTADAGLIRLAGFVGLVCVAADGLERRHVWTLLRRWTVLCGLLSILVGVQILTGEVWVDNLSLPGLKAPEGLAVQQRGDILRPSGTATHPLELSAVFSMTMPVAVVVAIRERRRPWLMRLVAVVVPVILLLSGSRSALLCGLVAFLILMPALPLRLRWIASGLGVVGLAAFFVLKPGFLGALRELFAGADEDPSVASRTESYRVVYEYWQTNPWLGRGVGTFLPHYWILDNEYLLMLMGGGLVVVGALLGLFVTTTWSALRTRATEEDPEDRMLVMALLAGAAAGAVSAAFFDAFSFPQAAGCLFLLIGLVGASGSARTVGRPRPELSPPRSSTPTTAPE